MISVLTGVTSTFADAHASAGAFGLVVGFPLVFLGTLCVALCMAELSSAFPTAGSVYHWSALLGGPAFGWFAGAINLVGQIAIVAAIDLSCAESFAALFGLERWLEPLFAAIVLMHALVNLGGVALVTKLNDLSAYLHVAGLLVLVSLLFWFAPPRDSFFALAFRPSADVTPRRFLFSLLMGMWTFTGYDAAAHASEETRDADTKTPRAILAAVLASAVGGYALLVALAYAATGSDVNPYAVIARTLGTRFGLLANLLVGLAMWFCGLSSITSASRMVYAFARDGGIPLSQVFRRVSARGIPSPATWAMSVVPVLVVFLLSRIKEYAPAVGASVFVAIASLSTIALNASYAIPIALHAWTRRPDLRRGPFSLGKLSRPLGLLAVVWVVFVLVALSIPPNEMGAALFLGCLTMLFALYVVRVRGRFFGPHVTRA